MAEHLAGQIPSLPGTFLKAATRMYSNPPDEHFVIARHPAHSESATGTAGFSGHGFEFVPVVGEIVADLALTGTIAHPIDLFDLSRPGPLRRTTPESRGPARTSAALSSVANAPRRRPPSPCNCTHQTPLTSTDHVRPPSSDLVRRTGPTAAPA